MAQKCAETHTPTPQHERSPHVCDRELNHDGSHECQDGRRW